ncbi:ABC transporter permease [Listeria ilorinensis]|uniref:ABC transporter permease n=1 Tax=Listeria ilorinensis TaxID=2867439 RepID=UPI001EF67FD1|nr:ABC transporter permease [Listeria ilorinensis]
MFLGFRELLFSKLRYLLVTGIMILIMLLALILSGLANGLAYDNASSVSDNGVPYYAITKDAQGKLSRSQFPESDFTAVKNDENVKDAAVLGQSMQTLKRESDDKKYSIAFFAIQPGQFLDPKITEGKGLSVTKPDEIVVDSSLKKDGLKLGDVLMDDMLNKELKIVGFTEDQKYSHAPVVYINMATWQSINPVLYHQKIPQINAIAIKTKDADQGVKLSNKELTTLTSDEFLNQIPGYSAEQMTLNMMIAFLIVIGGFILTAFFYVMTLQKTTQFGILKALGTKTSTIASSVIIQVVIISLISIAISVGVTLLLPNVLPEAMPFRLSSMTIVLYSLIFFVVALLGSLLSLRKVAKVDALDAIRGGDE